MKEDITNLIKFVMDLIEDVPEEYRKSSFEVLLHHFLTSPSLPAKSYSSKVIKQKKSVEKNSIQEIITSEYDWAATWIKRLIGIGQYLAILKIVKNDFNVDTLSASDIKNILDQKFREKKTINTISMSLMDAVGKYVDRIKAEKEFRYRITASGESRLEEIFQGSKKWKLKFQL